MAQPFPYAYYACDCFDNNRGDEERTFDPRSPRAAFSLFPLEQLLYCEDCLAIRCPRCVVDETLNWFCPSCLFEVPSSVVKSDGNRCTRNCFNCPVCTAPLSVNSLENPDQPSATGGPFILACAYCHWSTAETGIEFEKHTGIHAQLARVGNGGRLLPTQRERDKERERRLTELDEPTAADTPTDGDTPTATNPPTATDPPTATNPPKPTTPPSRDILFANLAAFYKSQIDAQTPANPFAAHDLAFSSPSTYSRILNLYSTTARTKKRDKPPPMREAAADLEGLAVLDPAADMAAIDRLRKHGWPATLSPAQKLAQPDPHVHFDDQLRPVATLLCTKRSKRCRSCRHILSKPESKITSTRYKIKLLALNHIPRISIRALPSPIAQQPLPTAHQPLLTAQPPTFNYNSLRQGIPTNFIIHLTNPLFDPVRVTLATPSTTPGRIHSKVTILCPEFEIGANTDVWDDALSSSAPVNKGTLVEDGAIEPGKPYDRGRNWTSVVIEVVPGFLESTPKPFSFSAAQGRGHADLDEDEDVVEIPIFVRLEFEADAIGEERLGGEKGDKERRDEAFWCVVGVGRIAD